MIDTTTTVTLVPIAEPAVVPVVAPAQKPAWKTTEGWIAFLTACLGAATTTHLVGDGSQAVVIGGMAITVLSMAVHSWSRTKLKVAA